MYNFSSYHNSQCTDIYYRFNERFILSLASNKRCVVIDDSLNVLPLSSHIKHVVELPRKSTEDSVSPEEAELRVIKEKFQDSQPTVRKKIFA